MCASANICCEGGNGEEARVGGGHFACQDTGPVRDKDVPGSISESAAFQALGTRE